MKRRTLLSAGVGLLTAAPESVPAIDCHIHLFDTGRPQGVPWPPKTDKIRYKPALPDRYIALTAKLGVVGAIEVEASPLLEDNQWVLDVAAKAPVIVGTIGNVYPGGAKFRTQLESYAKNPLFRGIRYGNLWGNDLGKELGHPEFVAGLKDLAKMGMVLDSANPNLRLLADLRRVTDLVPNLRVVIDHLPGMDVPSDDKRKALYEELLRDLTAREQVFVKVSAVLRRQNGTLSTDASFYQPRLDEMWQRFGEDRVIYGSDWPNSDGLGTYEQVFAVVKEYAGKKGRAAEEKYFWKNSRAAYRWVARNAAQRKLV